MPRPRVAMRNIREVLRLTFGEGLRRRQVSASAGVPLTTVSDYVARAVLAGLGWPLPEGLDDDGLERLLYPPVPPSAAARPPPDWAYVQRELRRKSVTLQLLWLEYRKQNPGGYGYSQFCNLYRAWSRQVDVVMRQVRQLFVHSVAASRHSPHLRCLCGLVLAHDPGTDPAPFQTRLAGPCGSRYRRAVYSDLH